MRRGDERRFPEGEVRRAVGEPRSEKRTRRRRKVAQHAQEALLVGVADVHAVGPGSELELFREGARGFDVEAGALEEGDQLRERQDLVVGGVAELLVALGGGAVGVLDRDVVREACDGALA